MKHDESLVTPVCNGNGEPDVSAATPSTAPNPLDPELHRLLPDLSASMGMRMVQTNIPVRKPDKSWWIQVCRDEAYQLATMVVELKEDQEVYMVSPDLREAMIGDPLYKPVLMLTTIARPKNQIFIWPVSLTPPGEKENKWHASARSAAKHAMGQWVRVMPNMQGGGYDVWTTIADLPAPVWPTQPMAELLQASFQGRLIDSMEHPVFLRLRAGQ